MAPAPIFNFSLNVNYLIGHTLDSRRVLIKVLKTSNSSFHLFEQPGRNHATIHSDLGHARLVPLVQLFLPQQSEASVRSRPMCQAATMSTKEECNVSIAVTPHVGPQSFLDVVDPRRPTAAGGGRCRRGQSYGSTGHLRHEVDKDVDFVGVVVAPERSIAVAHAAAALVDFGGRGGKVQADAAAVASCGGLAWVLGSFHGGWKSVFL